MTSKPSPAAAALCPPHCPECAALEAADLAEIEAAHRVVLAGHDELCVAEAVADAYSTGHDDDETVWMIAAQSLGEGYSPCRCLGSAHVTA